MPLLPFFKKPEEPKSTLNLPKDPLRRDPSASSVNSFVLFCDEPHSEVGEKPKGELGGHVIRAHGASKT